ncbi:unnamed protein product [Candida verbasci]|uniref:non-specific serine/threonine protein kinase n=1 Tax=Candida verbasci TaxID=1227364 RepID=A0A9W4TTP1_9ASCO|nr:unnamed protein product [Candida verbasci]
MSSNNFIYNAKTNDSSLQDLEDNLNSIYKTYTTNNNNNDSIDTLDSNNNTAGSHMFHYKVNYNNGQTPQQLPMVHVSSRLSSLGDMQDARETITKSAPGTPLSMSSFDFRPNYPRAVTNSSLNVLLDTPGIDSEFRQLVDQTPPPISQPRPPESEEFIDAEQDEIPKSKEMKEDELVWRNRGAAARTVRSNNGEPQIIRRSVGDFKFGKELGEGSYSTVILATDKFTSKQYAVKVLDKRHIIKEKKVKYVNIEKHALNRLSNRMGIISLYFTFQDKDSLYFVLDYAANGELLTLIKNHNTLNEECTRHFGAQILDAIKYMHDNGVIHRDIKPENILLDDKMRIQMTDFGTARLLEKKNDESEDYPVDVRAKSFVGTAEYVSPELLESKYCGKPGDIWAFGCIIYQMIAGKPPFKATNEYLTFQKITKLQYAFSAGFPNILRDLVKKILVLQPSRRATISDIQNHYFFNDVDFDDFESIWYRETPEIGPYKMTAKSMMKIPEHSSSSAMINKKQIRKTSSNNSPVTPRSRPSNQGKTSIEKSIPKTASTANSSNERVSAASVAAFVLNKPNNNSNSSFEDALSSTKSSTTDLNNTRTNSRKSQADYIPGTNILRPQINTRPSVASYSKSSSRSDRSKSVTKSTTPKPLEVTPPTTLETAWRAYLSHPDERVLRIGPVIFHKESTELFERKNKALLHESPLDMAKTQRNNRSGTSLLSQMVNGVNPIEHTNVDESIAISEPELTAALKRNSSKKEQRKSSGGLERSASSGKSSRLNKHSFFKKLGLGQINEKKDNDISEETIINQYSLGKPQTSTMVVTSHGRALIFTRNDIDANYKLILEIQLKYPFIHFQELVSSQNKFSKLLPTVGVFVISSTESSFVFEVEKFEVNQWTEVLFKAKTNEIERGKLIQSNAKDEQQQQKKSESKKVANTSNKSSPKLLASPAFKQVQTPLESKSKQSNNTTTSEPSRSRENHQSSSMLKLKLKTNTPRRKPPPPVSPPTEVNVHTGLPKTSGETGFLHAAQLAVSNNASPVTNNRRSSFSKSDGSKIDTNKIRTTYNSNNSESSPSSPTITTMNSKFLARSRKK